MKPMVIIEVAYCRIGHSSPFLLLSTLPHLSSLSLSSFPSPVLPLSSLSPPSLCSPRFPLLPLLHHISSPLAPSFPFPSPPSPLLSRYPKRDSRSHQFCGVEKLVTVFARFRSGRRGRRARGQDAAGRSAPHQHRDAPQADPFAARK